MFLIVPLRSDPPQRPHTKINDILEGVTSQRLLDRPPTGEKKEQLPPHEKQKNSTVKGEKKSTTLFFGDLKANAVPNQFYFMF